MRTARARSSSRFAACLLTAVFLTGARADANTIIVDAQGSGQYTDIPPAIAAAQPGDVVLVLSGVYSGFTLDKGLRIIGYGGASCGAVQISGVSGGNPAALVHFALPSLTVSSCPTPVLIEEITGLLSMNVSGARDVRVHQSPVHAPDGSPQSTTLAVSGSRLELVESPVSGSNGIDCVSLEDGGQACAFSSSRVHVSQSSIDGGNGSTCFNDPAFYAGNGQAGIGIVGGQTILCGGGTSHVSGGGGGINFFYDNCLHDGDGSCGVGLDSTASLWHSAVSIGSGVILLSPLHCIYGTLPPICGTGQATHVVPDDPTLSVAGYPATGATVTFTLKAPTGSSAILYFGRQAIVVPDSNPAVIEQLTPMARIVNLGMIPTSGQVQFAWPISMGLQPGTLLVAQAEVMVSSSSTQRTNSVPVLVR